MKTFAKDICYTLSTLAAALLLWQLVATLVAQPKLFPSVTFVFSNSLPEFALFGEGKSPDFYLGFKVIFLNFLITFKRVIVGLTIGWFSGFCLGIITTRSASYRRQINNILAFFRYIPLLALIPIFLHWFGDSQLGIFFYIIFAVTMLVASDTYSAISNVPHLYRQNARLLGANSVTVMKTVELNHVVPELIANCRNMLGLVWAFSLGAEYLTSNNGLGFLVYQSYLYADMGKLLILCLVYLISGISGYLILTAIFNKKTQWLNRLN